MLTRLVRPVARIAQRGARRYHEEKDFKFATMDDLPVPQGSWKDRYEQMQKTYNLQLAAGILIFAGTFTFGKMNGCFYLNFYPPVPKEEL